MKTKAIIKESFKDLGKVFDTPIIFIIIAISAVLAVVPNLIAGKSSHFLKTLIDVIVIIAGIYMTIMKIESFYLFKKNKLNELSFYKGSKKFSQYIFGTLLFILLNAILMIAVLIFVKILEVLSLGDKIVELIFLILMITGVISIFVRFGYYSYLIIIEGDLKPLDKSFKMTKGYYKKLILIFITNMFMILPYMFVFYISQEYKFDNVMGTILTLPFLIVFTAYYLILNTNTYIELKRIWDEKIKEEENTFDKRSKNWDDEQKIKMAKEFFEKIKESVNLNEIDNLLDLGAGTGLMTMQFKDYVKNIDALDSSKGMLEVLKEKIEYSETKNINIIHGEIEDVKKTYDCVFSSMVFHHIENIDNLLKNIKEKLNEKGILIVIDLLKEDGTFHNDSKGIYHEGFEEEKIKEYFESNNLKNIELRNDLQVKKLVKNGEMKEFKIFLIKANKND